MGKDKGMTGEDFLSYLSIIDEIKKEALKIDPKGIKEPTDMTPKFNEKELGIVSNIFTKQLSQLLYTGLMKLMNLLVNIARRLLRLITS